MTTIEFHGKSNHYSDMIVRITITFINLFLFERIERMWPELYIQIAVAQFQGYFFGFIVEIAGYDYLLLLWGFHYHDGRFIFFLRFIGYDA